MIGRPAQRQRHLEVGKTLQEYVELSGILRREHARQQAVGGVVDAEAGLRADDIRTVGAENVERCAQLAGLGPILGVEHRNEGAARKSQRVVERLWLCPWSGIGRDDDLNIRHRTEPRDGCARTEIVQFNNEFDVELFAGIVEFIDVFHQRRDRRCLVVECCDPLYRQVAGCRAAGAGVAAFWAARNIPRAAGS